MKAISDKHLPKMFLGVELQKEPPKAIDKGFTMKFTITDISAFNDELLSGTNFENDIKAAIISEMEIHAPYPKVSGGQKRNKVEFVAPSFEDLQIESYCFFDEKEMAYLLIIYIIPKYLYL